jgi:hypothetical protein
MSAISSRLRKAVRHANDAQAMQICGEILTFGGERNPRSGARPFLNGQASLTAYLALAQKQLSLSSADLSALGAVSKMNSMLTKIHALASDDGLPIYDSRVAVAIAALVEIYRQKMATRWPSVPKELRFPAVDSERDVRRVFPGALPHGSVASRGAHQTLLWSQAKVRLGWILEEVLRRDPLLFSETEFVGAASSGSSMRTRMHAFEAALFMIGYDVRCLGSNLPGRALPKPSKPSKRAGKKVPARTLGGAVSVKGTVGPLRANLGRISLDFGGEFPFPALIRHVKTLPGKAIVIGAQKVSRRDHAKHHSLDYWLRDHANQPDQMQATRGLVDKIVASGKFQRVSVICPTSGRRVAALEYK